jgi:hypothetical protein
LMLLLRIWRLDGIVPLLLYYALSELEQSLLCALPESSISINHRSVVQGRRRNRSRKSVEGDSDLVFAFWCL